MSPQTSPWIGQVDLKFILSRVKIHFCQLPSEVEKNFKECEQDFLRFRSNQLHELQTLKKHIQNGERSESEFISLEKKFLEEQQKKSL